MKYFNYMNNFETILIDVNEKINKKYLNDFLLTSLNKKNIHIKDIYYSYLKHSNQYQIFYSSDFLPFIYIFESYYLNKTTISTDLFFSKEYFLIYINKKIYFYKELNNNSLSEILKFIKYEIKLNIDNVIDINEENFNELKYKYIEHIYKRKKNRASFYLLLYSSFLLIILFYSLTIKENIVITKTNTIKNEKIVLSTKLISLFSTFSKYNIKIKDIEYNNKNIILALYVSKINDFYEFSLNEEVKISFSYKQVKKGYEINAIFNLY